MFAVPASTLKGHEQSSGNLKQLALTIGAEAVHKQSEVSVSAARAGLKTKQNSGQTHCVCSIWNAMLAVSRSVSTTMFAIIVILIGYFLRQPCGCVNL